MTCESERCCVKQLFHHKPKRTTTVCRVLLIFNLRLTRIMLIFLKQCCSFLAFKAPWTLSSWENGQMVVVACSMTYKEAKLHVIMFNTNFQWGILPFETAEWSFSLSLPPGLEVYIPVGLLGKGVTCHTSFHLKRLKTQLSSLARLLLLRSLSTFLQRLMSACMLERGSVFLSEVSSRYSAALKESFSVRHTDTNTHCDNIIIIMV